MVDKAIAYLQSIGCKNTTSYEETRLTVIAIQALRTRKPMLVNHERTFWKYYHYCPACSELLKAEALRYCNHCGQRLDWSNYELGLKYVR